MRRITQSLQWYCLLVLVCLLFSAVFASTSRRSAPATTPYSTLGVSDKASDKEITKAYRKLCLKHHPDKGGNEDTFKTISEAYQILSDPKKKKQFDEFGVTSDHGPIPAHPFAPRPNSRQRRQQHYQQHGGFTTGSVPPEFAKFSKTFRMNNNQGFGINQGQSFFGNSFGPAAGLSQQQFAGPSNDDLLEMLRRMQMGQGVGKDSFSTTTFPGRRQATKQTPPESFTRTVSCTLSELNKGATKKLSIKYGKESRVYTIQLQPHWKPGTKVTFKARDGFPEMIFVIQVKDAVFQRRGDNDVVYRYPKNLKNIVAEANLNGLVSLDVPLLDGTMSRKKIRKTALLAMSSGGKPLKLQGQGMIGKDKQTRGNMIVEFH